MKQYTHTAGQASIQHFDTTCWKVMAHSNFQFVSSPMSLKLEA